MPDKKDIVINTGPLISLVAAFDSLDILQSVFKTVHVPFEVGNEIKAGGKKGFAVGQFEKDTWLKKYSEPVLLTPYLEKTLDLGEASVIQLAINKKIETVCIDETAGRRIARLSGLTLTGSVGILIRAQKNNFSFSMKEALEKMENRGIWLSKTVKSFALKNAIFP